MASGKKLVLRRRPMTGLASSAVTVSRRAFLGLASLGTSILSLAGARTAAAQRKTTPAAAIDVHAHFFPEKFLKSLAEEGGPPDLQVEFSASGVPTLVRGTVRLALDVTYWDLDKRLERMNGQNVTMHALSLTVPMVHWAPPERGAQLAQLVNDAMAEAHTAFPDRFVGCATLPVQDPALALKELERVAGGRAIRGVYLPTNVGGRELSDPALFPVYKRCQALNLPVLLHPVTVIGAERLRSYYLSNLLGNPFDTAVAAASLILGGVLDRYPRLNVVLPHAGGALPYLWGRLQHGQTVREEVKDAAQRAFGQYLRRFHYDTIVHSPELLRFLVGLVGADRVVLGSDYCFDMGYERPRDVVMKTGRPIARRSSAATRAACFGSERARVTTRMLDVRETGASRLDEGAPQSRERLDLPRVLELAVVERQREMLRTELLHMAASLTSPENRVAQHLPVEGAFPQASREGENPWLPFGHRRHPRAHPRSK